jgi:hypothetical protein
MADMDERAGGLLSWQWATYPSAHTTRINLLIHIVAVPVFQIGTIALIGALAMGPLYAVFGLALMAGAMAAQGRGHGLEPQAPARFRGPGDVFARIMAEQWIAFPRFVLSGGFARAWRAAPSGGSTNREGPR